MIIAIILVVVGFVLRFIPHVPNFTPVIALAVFAGVFIKHRYLRFLPVLMLIVTDLIIGLHDVVLFTWGSLICLIFASVWLRTRTKTLYIVSFGLVANIIFYLITNFGVWLAGWYPHTLQGLFTCYYMGIPFLRISIFGNLFYLFGLIGLFKIVEHSRMNACSFQN